MAGAGKDHVQAFLAAALVNGAEVHEHFAGGIVSIANTEDDNIALIALDIFKIFHEEAAELVVFLAGVFGLEAGAEIRVLLAETGEGILDFSLLSLGESYNADAELCFLPQQGSDEACDVARFGCVTPIGVNALFEAMKTDAALEERLCVLVTLLLGSDEQFGPL